MQGHIDAHLGGTGGPVPAEWMSRFGRARCRGCGLSCAASRGIHPRCRARENRNAPPANTSAGVPPGVTPPASAALPTLDEVHRKQVPTLKHIPQKARGAWAQCLIRCLAAVVYFNNTAAWTELEMLPKCVLCTPPRGGKAHALAAATFTSDRLARWLAGERTTLWKDLPTPKQGRTNNSEEARLTRSVALAREGFDRKACAALVSTPPVKASADAAAKLRKLHPNATDPVCGPLSELPAAPSITPDMVEEALRAFPKDTAPGNTVLRAQHLLDACTPAHKATVLDQLAAVANVLARGEAPTELSPYLGGATLFALEKKGGGLRPIAIGETLRRLVGKTLCKTAQEECKEYFWPLQLGVACSQGTECAIHTVRQWAARNANKLDRVILKLDFANAFNTISRSVALSELLEHFPQLARWAQWLYGHRSYLTFGSHLLESATGVQQGDPLGPLLFACAIHPLVKQLAELSRNAPGNEGHGLTLFYLDDGIICGDVHAVAEALRLVQAECGRLGLSLKLSKCELILASGATSVDLGQLFPRDVLVDPVTGRDRVVRDGNFEFLGAPIGSDTFCAKVTKERVNEAATALEAICKHQDTQIGVRLLRACAGFCKLVYSARVVGPHAHANELALFDQKVRQAFADLTGLYTTDEEWEQAGRGFDTAGLGLRHTARHAPAAYLASRVASRARCGEIDPHFVWEIDDPQSAPAAALTALNAQLEPNGYFDQERLESAKQKTLSIAIDQASFQRHLARLSVSGQADLRSETLPGASGFLSCIPSKSIGLAMAPAEFIVELQTRLQMPVYQTDRYCPCCAAVLDTRGCHARKCMAAGDVVACHNGVRNLVGRFATSAGLAPSLEKAELLPPRPDDPTSSNLRRPADVFLPTFVHGAPAALDFAVVSPQRQDVVALAAETTGAAASLYESYKRSHLNTETECAQQGVSFIPMVAESSGGWGSEGMKHLRQLAKVAARHTGAEAGDVMGQWLQSLCVVIRSAKARAVLRRASVPQNPLVHAAEAALTALVAADSA